MDRTSFARALRATRLPVVLGLWRRLLVSYYLELVRADLCNTSAGVVPVP